MGVGVRGAGAIYILPAASVACEPCKPPDCLALFGNKATGGLLDDSHTWGIYH